MMAFTHGVIGAVTFAGASALAGTPEAMPLTGATLGAATVAAWLPDVDTPHSKAGWCVYPLALWIERRFGHRTVTHSLVGALLFALLCSPLLWLPQLAHSHALQGVWGALLCGYVSHLLADAATKSGVPLAWPSRARWVFPGHERYRIRTGSRGELGLFLIFVLLGVLFVPPTAARPEVDDGIRKCFVGSDAQGRAGAHERGVARWPVWCSACSRATVSRPRPS